MQFELIRSDLYQRVMSEFSRSARPYDGGLHPSILPTIYNHSIFHIILHETAILPENIQLFLTFNNHKHG